MEGSTPGLLLWVWLLVMPLLGAFMTIPKR